MLPSPHFQPCPWRIDILSDFGGNSAGQLRRATVAECICFDQEQPAAPHLHAPIANGFHWNCGLPDDVLRGPTVNRSFWKVRQPFFDVDEDTIPVFRFHRQAAGEASRGDSRNSGKAGCNIGLRADYPLRVRDQRLRDCNTYRLNPLRMRKPWCYGSQGEEAPNHQPGSHQQDKCKGHLGDNECILSAELSGPLGRASCALNSAGDAGPEDRCQPEQQARPYRADEIAFLQRLVS